MHTVRETFGLRSLKVRLALASAVLILASVAMTVIFVLREVGRSTEQIVLDSQEDDARRIAATISRRLVGLQRALRGAALQMSAATLADRDRVGEFVAGQSVLATLFSGVFFAATDGTIVVINDERGVRDPRTSIADRDYFKDTVRERRPMIGGIGLSRVSNEPIVVLTMPVFGGDGSVAGVLGGSLRLSSRSLVDDPRRGRTVRNRRTRRSSSTPRAGSSPIRAASGCCATAPPSRASPPRCRTGACAAARSSRPATAFAPARTRSESPASPTPTGSSFAPAASTRCSAA